MRLYKLEYQVLFIIIIIIIIIIINIIIIIIFVFPMGFFCFVLFFFLYWLFLFVCFCLFVCGLPSFSKQGYALRPSVHNARFHFLGASPTRSEWSTSLAWYQQFRDYNDNRASNCQY